MTSGERTAIGWWKKLGSDQPDVYLRFFIFYMCLDAWMVAESGEDSDRKKLDWLVNQPNDLKTYWDGIKNGTQCQSWLNGLAKESPIENMQPSKRGIEYVQFSNITDFEEMVRFIYQIRCNLFHGAKSLFNDRDTRLVTLGGKLLERWIEWTYAKTR